MPAVLFHAATNHYTGLFLGTDLFVTPLSTHFVPIKVALYLLLAVAVIGVGGVQGRRGWWRRAAS